MKITFLCPSLNMGGGTKVVSIHADYLKKQGHDVLIVTVPYPSPTIKERLKGFKQLKFEYPSRLKSYFDSLDVKVHHLDKSRPIVSSDLPDADVVIATWWETAEWLEQIDLKKGKKIYFIQGHEIFDYVPKERAIATYKTSMHKIVVSRWLKNVIETGYGEKNIDLVYNAAEKDQFKFNERNKQTNPTVGFLLSDSSVKGIDIAIKVIDKLKNLFPTLIVFTFGATIVKIPNHNLKSLNFKLLPTPEKISAIYHSCDVWLSASRSEGFNLTVIEAMSCGTPVVCTKTGWPLEVIKQQENGVIVDIDDVNALVEGISWILNLPNNDWKKMAFNASKTADSFSWEKSSKTFEQILLNQLK
jgi:glycosyltransferase involved in cell wall biosynthesis